MSKLPGTKGRRRIYLMRHGRVNYARDAARAGGLDFVPLTERGRKEAEAAGIALSHVPFDRAVCTSLPRTRETAEIVLSHQDSDAVPALEEDARLREIVSAGITFSSLAEAPQSMLDFFTIAHEPDSRLGPDGEVFADAYARATRAIEDYLCQPAWSHLLIVAHEGINRLILGWACGAGLKAIGAFEQDTACVNVLDVDTLHVDRDDKDTEIQRVMIKAVNLTPYNYTKHGMNMTSLEAIFNEEE